MGNGKNRLTIGLFLAYFLCCFIKLSPSAVMPQIQMDLNLNSSVTGLISSMYFIPYALMQFLSVPMCRRFGAGRTFAYGLFVSVVGLAVFSLGVNSAMLAIGRFLTGLGTGPFFIGLVYHLQDCYSGPKYVKVYGFTIFASNLGSAIASTPLKLLLNVVSWKSVFLTIMLLAFALGSWILFLSRESGIQASEVLEKSNSLFMQIAGDFRRTLTKPFFICALFCWITQGFMLMSYQGLWCIKWTSLAFAGMENVASFSGLAISLGLVISGLWGERIRLVIPQLGRKTNRGNAVNINEWFCLATVVFVVCTRLLTPSLPCLFIALLADALYGYSAGLMILQVGAYVREHTNQAENSSVMGVFNCIGCFGQQASQWITGAAIDAFAVSQTGNLSFSYTYLCVAVVIAFIALGTRRTLAK